LPEHRYRHQLGCRQSFEILEREFGLAVSAFATDGDLPSPDVDLRNIGEMVSDKKRVVRGDGGAEIFERGLVVRRPVAKLDQGLLSRQRVEHRVAARPLGKRRRQVERACRGLARGEDQACARCDETPARQHGVLPSRSFWRKRLD